MLPDAYLRDLVASLDHEADVATLKKRLAAKHGVARIPTNIEVLTSLDDERLARAKPFLLTKPMRSGSGVTVVAIMTRPSRCPHGRCTYCPGGLKSAFGDVPQSYTGREPASMRGARADYDAYVQVFNRLEQYVVTGHDPQKVELIIMGGTFPNEGAEYQDAFVANAFRALNDFSREFYKDGDLLVEKFKQFFLLPGSIRDEARTKSVQENILEVKSKNTRKLSALQKENERAHCRCVGLTIETRPSPSMREEGLRMLRQGCTRVELGVQTTFDDALAAVHRGHDVQASIDSMATLRDLGFKLNVHVMLGLPRMTRERDLEAARRIFTDADFKPDMVKLYPCMVMPGTPLYDEYRAGRYTPLSTAEAAALIADIVPLVPEWCRIMRVQRDIPTTATEAGVDRTNLRQLVEEQLARKDVESRDIRAREIRERPIRDTALRVTTYEAAGGVEHFIQLVEPGLDALIGFCRLRLPARALTPELDGAALVRELHVYGRAVPIGAPGESQHRGYGARLLAEAERLAAAGGRAKLLIISGVGVREYYRRRGYVRDGAYMAKALV